MQDKLLFTDYIVFSFSNILDPHFIWKIKANSNSTEKGKVWTKRS